MLPPGVGARLVKAVVCHSAAVRSLRDRDLTLRRLTSRGVTKCSLAGSGMRWRSEAPAEVAWVRGAGRSGSWWAAVGGMAAAAMQAEAAAPAVGEVQAGGPQAWLCSDILRLDSVGSSGRAPDGISKEPRLLVRPGLGACGAIAVVTLASLSLARCSEAAAGGNCEDGPWVPEARGSDRDAWRCCGMTRGSEGGSGGGSMAQQAPCSRARSLAVAVGLVSSIAASSCRRSSIILLTAGLASMVVAERAENDAWRPKAPAAAPRVAVAPEGWVLAWARAWAPPHALPPSGS